MTKAKILIVEDDAIVAMDVENRLKNLGYSVLAIVDNGKDAIKKATAYNPDLVLMDIVLKGDMDGIEAAEIIRSSFEIPIIFLTAYADEEKLERAKLTMPFGYILKPFRDRDIKITIEMACYTAKINAKQKRMENALLVSKQQLETVKEIGAMACSTLDLKVILQRILSGMINAVNASAGMIFLKNMDTGCLSLHTSIGLSNDFVKEYENRNIELGEGLTGSIAQNGVPIYIPANSSSDPRIARAVTEKEGFNSFIGVPISFDDNIIGVMNILNRPPDILSQDKSTLITAVCAYIGSAIHNAQLYTHLEQAEKSLNKSETIHRTLAENIPGIVYRLFIRENHRMQFFNNMLYKMTGYSVEELEKGEICSIDPMIIPEDKPDVITAVKKAFVEKRPFEIEYRLKTKNGDVRYYFESGSPIYGTDGNPLHIDGVIFDVTESKHAEILLQEKESYYRSLLHHMHDDILLIDPDYRIVDINNSIIDTLGLKREDVVGRYCFEISHGYNEPCNKYGEACPLREVFETGEPRHCIHEHHHSDGSLVWVDILFSPMKDKNGKVTHVIEAVRDITDLINATERVKISEKKYRNLVKNAPLGCISLDTDGNMLEINPALRKILDSPSDESTLPINVLTFPPLMKAGISNDFRNCIESGESGVFERKYISQWGKELYLKSHLQPMKDKNDRITGVQAIIEDISKNKNLEARLQRAQKMEAIGTLAGGIAHDFNNILFPMMGFTEMALEGISQDSPIRDSLNEVLGGIKRAGDLVKQILTFSRQTKKELKPLRIQNIIREVLKLTKSTLPSTIEISQYINYECGHIMADAIQIHQVVMNLITNAFHAMEETGGKLDIRLEEIELNTEDASDLNLVFGPYACLTVTDTGHGIKRNVMDRLFDPYFTTKENGKGTGLGLSVVHGIVQNYNGNITVISEPGKGSAFHVYLPVTKIPMEKEEMGMEVNVLTGNERILFVDDEETIIRMVKQMLELRGYHVTSRTSSVEALEAFKANPDKFDLVITDMTMPNMTGTQLSQKLLKIKPDIPIIICTGFSEKISEDKAKVMGFRGYVMKPVVINELAKKIRGVLDQD